MGSAGVVDRDAITAAFDALDAAVDGVAGLDFDALCTPEWLALLERCERVRRRLPVPEHQLINHLARQAAAEELGGKLSHGRLADGLYAGAGGVRTRTTPRMPRWRHITNTCVATMGMGWP
ncbi:MAG TPA: hypothetical protein VED43_12760, partial [Mycobacterium sp.]|nr:hypothetical protein [Mycobacterium sp.]